MNKNYTEVMIAGKTYDIGGYEDPEYLQKVALYINTKISELRKIQGFLRQPTDFQNAMILLNIADEYYKLKERAEELEEKSESLEKEVFNLKHELVTQQIKLERKRKRAEKAEEKAAAEAAGRTAEESSEKTGE